MDFYVREDARSWFRDIRNDLDLDFDIFYFCFIAGISANRKKDPSAKTAQLVERFPKPYQNHGRLLVALFLSRELKTLGILGDEKGAIYNAISHFVQPESPNFLSDEGVHEFNKYAHGGYEILSGDWFDDRPRSLETFLRIFHQKVNSALLRKD